MREIEMTAKTVEEAVEAACRALGVDRDDLGVSYEVLEFPARRLFKSIPAKVRVTVEEPEAPAAPAAQPAPAAPETAAAPAPATVLRGFCYFFDTLPNHVHKTFTGSAQKTV